MAAIVVAPPRFAVIPARSAAITVTLPITATTAIQVPCPPQHNHHKPIQLFARLLPPPPPPAPSWASTVFGTLTLVPHTLDECVYMEHPPSYIDATNPGHVCCLRKALYGLKQAWFQTLALSLK